MIKLLFIVLLTGCQTVSAPHSEPKTIQQNMQPSIHALSYTDIHGEPVKLEKFKGKKILIVNTASECGYTPQYNQLQELSQLFPENLVVIGFPSNDFGGQEPGANNEIETFCKKNYGVTFPLSEKVNINSKPVSPIFEWLTQKSKNGLGDFSVKWNFNKFLLDEDGRLIGYFESSVRPLDEAIVKYIE
jgi:glutathione peroxidase